MYMYFVLSLSMDIYHVSWYFGTDKKYYYNLKKRISGWLMHAVNKERKEESRVLYLDGWEQQHSYLIQLLSNAIYRQGITNHIISIYMCVCACVTGGHRK